MLIEFVTFALSSKAENLLKYGDINSVVIFLLRLTALSGGPLGSKRYCLSHVELRWGAVDSRGSEHTMNGVGCSAEVRVKPTKVLLENITVQFYNNCTG